MPISISTTEGVIMLIGEDKTSTYIRNVKCSDLYINLCMMNNTQFLTDYNGNDSNTRYGGEWNRTGYVLHHLIQRPTSRHLKKRWLKTQLVHFSPFLTLCMMHGWMHWSMSIARMLYECCKLDHSVVNDCISGSKWDGVKFPVFINNHPLRYSYYL